MSQAVRYKAFISYSHRDSAAVRWLHRKLEGYRVPKALRGTGVQERLTPVFRDRDELASSAALSDSIQSALDASAALIVACSPAAVASRWVNEEVKYFRSRHPERKVFAFILSGDPGADPRTHAERACFPPALILRDVSEPDGPIVEPAAPDSRKDADGRDTAFLKLAAGLLDVPFDKLRQRELRRQQQRWAFLGAGSVGLSAVFAVLAWQAMVARDLARVEQARAELEAQTARQTSDFMISLFEVSDPGEARGNTITAREVLDRGVERIGETEFARPLIKARLLGTMGTVYSYLGLYPRALELLQGSEAFVEVQDPSSEEAAQRFDLLWERGDLQFRMGDYAAAKTALASIGEPDPRLPGFALREAKRRNLAGDIQFFEGNDTAARQEFDAALKALDAGKVDNPIQRARAIGGIGLILSFSGKPEEAVLRFKETYELLLAAHGEDHRYTLAALNQVATAHYQGGQSGEAERLYAKALKLGEKIYGVEHPEVGTYLNNLALVRMEACRFREAEPLLSRSLAIDASARQQRADDFAYIRNSLGLVGVGLGHIADARAHFLEALPIAEEHKHRMLGPIRNNLADLDCAQGKNDEGLALAQAAVEANTTEYGADHWRTAQSELTRAFCKPSDTQDSKVLDDLLQRVITRWGDNNLYAQRAIAQRRALALAAGDTALARSLAKRLDDKCAMNLANADVSAQAGAL